MAWVGIDTGGTFTDLVLADEVSGAYYFHKLLTVKNDPAQGILDGLRDLLAMAPAGTRIDFLVHGTTLGTNAMLEKRYAPTGMITTAGFRDVLELARQRRPAFYDLDVPKPEAPAPRDLRIEVGERLAYDGEEVRPLDEDELRSAVETLRAKGVSALAICFINAYSNPVHEQRAKQFIAEHWPDMYVSASAEISSEYREFERFATATVNACLMPVIDRYLRQLEDGLAGVGITARPRVMQSNGGAVSIPAICRAPINTFFSGPAGGVVAAIELARASATPDLITFDMGGTSTDVCLIRDGQPAMKNQSAMGGFPVGARTIDMHTIGSGGGSIAWRDPGGLLKVGPRSAGSTPGPVAYGRGGTECTVTDANFVLGRLNPGGLLGGRMDVYLDRAEAAMERLGQEVGLSGIEVAAGIVSIVNVSMMGAVRLITVEQGQDPRGFTLVPFGGAGALHAVEVAKAMGIRKVLVPPRPGLMSALGLLSAEPRGDFSVTRPLAAVAESQDKLSAFADELMARAADWLADEAGDSPEIIYEWSVEMRYLGQNYELAVEEHLGAIGAQTIPTLAAKFAALHENAYGYRMDNQPVEIVTIRLAVRLAQVVPKMTTALGTRTDPAGHRQVWFAGTGFVQTPIYDRTALPAGFAMGGPAIIEQMDTTTVLPPGATARIDAIGNIEIHIHDVETEGSE